MPYRDDTHDHARHELRASIESELAEIARPPVESADRLRARETELRRELTKLRFEQVQATRANDATRFRITLRLATPCDANWDDMPGDDRTRHCGKCDSSVHNLSAMTSDEAAAFLLEGANRAHMPCVRYFQRADGTVLTSDCHFAVRRKGRIRRFVPILAGGTIVAGMLVTSLVSELTQTPANCNLGGPCGPSVRSNLKGYGEAAPSATSGLGN